MPLKDWPRSLSAHRIAVKRAAALLCHVTPSAMLLLRKTASSSKNRQDQQRGYVSNLELGGIDCRSE